MIAKPAPSFSPEPGMLCRNVRTSGFKLALVVGYPSTASVGGKIRACFWRANSARWTKPTLVDISALSVLDETEHKAKTKMIERAAQAAIDHKIVQQVWQVWS